MTLITLSDFARFGTVVRMMAPDIPNRVLGVSRNLRGMRDYARKSRVACVITRKRNAHEGDPGGVLTVVYANGATCQAEFQSHRIMIDWARDRRSWRGAEFRHLDGTEGYLTRPGLIAGAACAP